MFNSDKMGFSCDVRESALLKFIRTKCRKLTGLETVYAGLIMFFVPSVLCENDWSRQLTYDKIYNSTTQYAQIQYVSKPLNTQVISNKYISKHSLEDTHNNDIDYLNNENNEGKLLVGFAKDPFRYSIPDEDYARGIRHIDPEPYKGDNRGKRGVFHLYNMIFCATGCEPLSYKGYGCYCGFLGAGTPTNGIDNCCKMHDQCYENIYCPFYTVYLQPYYWKCYYGQPLCALENYESRNQLVNRCAARLCECDRLFAMCVKQYQCPRRQSYCKSSPVRLLQNLLRFR